MKYKITLGFRGRGVNIMELSEEEKERLLSEEDLDDVFYDFVEERDYDFAYELYALDSNVDRYNLEVTDENGNTVYQSEDVEDLIQNDKTYADEDGSEYTKGYEFQGLPDGDYLVQVTTIKGCWYRGEIELDGEFDASKLYVVQDKYINDELTGECLYPIFHIYYLKGETPDLEGDALGLEFDSDMGDQYWDVYLMHLENKDCWEDLTD